MSINQEDPVEPLWRHSMSTAGLPALGFVGGFQACSLQRNSLQNLKLTGEKVKSACMGELPCFAGAKKMSVDFKKL